MEAQTQTGRPTGEDTARSRVLDTPAGASSFADALCAAQLVATKEQTEAIRALTALIARAMGYGDGAADWPRPAARRA